MVPTSAELIDRIGWFRGSGNDPLLQYTRAMLEALEIDEKVANYPGNVAAHAVNIAEGGGLAGIGIGWRDQGPTIRFIVGIVDEIDTLVADGDWNANDVDDRLYEIADNAVPYGTHDRVVVAMTLGAEVGDFGLVTDRTLGGVAGVALFEYASRVAGALAEAVGEAIEAIIDEAIDGDLCRVVDGQVDHGAGCPAGDWTADDDVECQHVANGEKVVDPAELIDVGVWEPNDDGEG